MRMDLGKSFVSLVVKLSISRSLNKLNGNSLYQIKPSDTSFRPTTVLANVDFPDPDSPTMPNVSPFLIAKLISLTARYRLPLGNL